MNREERFGVFKGLFWGTLFSIPLWIAILLTLKFAF